LRARIYTKSRERGGGERTCLAASETRVDGSAHSEISKNQRDKTRKNASKAVKNRANGLHLMKFDQISSNLIVLNCFECFPIKSRAF
jgi:hypothetical protein